MGSLRKRSGPTSRADRHHICLATPAPRPRFEPPGEVPATEEVLDAPGTNWKGPSATSRSALSQRPRQSHYRANSTIFFWSRKLPVWIR